jgi:hypothetical protein
MPDWDEFLQDIQSTQPVTVLEVQFKFRSDGLHVIFRMSDETEHKAVVTYYNVMHMGIDMYRLERFMECGTEMFFGTKGEEHV